VRRDDVGAEDGRVEVEHPHGLRGVERQPGVVLAARGRDRLDRCARPGDPVDDAERDRTRSLPDQVGDLGRRAGEP
jgi:hypothetical protein